LRLFSFGGYGLALAALALVVYGAIECPPINSVSGNNLAPSCLRAYFAALGSEFCSEYTDTLGRYVPGFYCPGESDEGGAVGIGAAGGAVRSAAVFCCGSASYKYCCTQRERDAGEGQAGLPLLLLGAALGAAAAIALLVVASCCCCSCCALYKKRHAAGAPVPPPGAPVPPPGTLYRTQAPSAASGVANMYSASAHNSLTTTPVDSATDRLLVELDAAPAPAAAALHRGNTFCRQTQQRNGRGQCRKQYTVIF